MERGLHADLPQTDIAAARTLALPMYPGLTEDEQAEVVSAVRAAVERRAPESPRNDATPTPAAVGAAAGAAAGAPAGTEPVRQ
jgi:hypothetical protein